MIYNAPASSTRPENERTGTPLYVHRYGHEKDPASHRAMPMTFSKGVEEKKDEKKRRAKKKFSSGNPIL